jgi:phosphinothricin acetyltransferase
VGIRSAVLDDLPRLLEIYNHYVVNTHVTFDVEPVSLDARKRWFEGFANDGPHRLIVNESNGGVDGYASSGTFRNKIAYRRSVESSIYLDVDACGAGVGRNLYATLLKDLENEDEVHRVYGGVALPNDASIALHERFGFERVATFSDVGFKFERYWDVAWFELSL